MQVATAIRGAIIQAKMSVVPVRRGYWGNKIGKPHTVPTKVSSLVLPSSSMYEDPLPEDVSQAHADYDMAQHARLQSRRGHKESGAHLARRTDIYTEQCPAEHTHE